MNQDKIQVIGIGLDGALGLTYPLQKLIENATILVGSQRHLSYFPEHPGQRIILGDFREAILKIQGFFRDGEKIIIFGTGDPLFFGLGRILLENFPPEVLEFYPHISSVQLAFSRLKIPWQDAKMISLHGRSLQELIPHLQQGFEKISILTDPDNNPGAIARLYQNLSLPIAYDFFICENLGDSQEKITQFSQKDINSLTELSGDHFASLNIVILIRKNDDNGTPLNLNQLPLFGLEDDTFLTFNDRPGLMTKREIRLLVLGELALQPGQIIWDIGAGTGSVSLEIARLCPSSQVYAIEKTAMGITLIEKNCQRLQVSNIIPISGNAPEILEKLPSPQRIFIGGSGGKLLEILGTCENKLTLNGILVLALATVEHIHQSLAWFQENHWNYRLLQVQISRSIPIANYTRFSPLNPVTLVTASRQKLST